MKSALVQRELNQLSCDDVNSRRGFLKKLGSSLLIAGSGLLLPENAEASIPRFGVVTIYNRTGIHLDYQIKYLKKLEDWTDWKNYHHAYSNGGWYTHYFPSAVEAKIRFDRIGGDDEFTEKIHNLPLDEILYQGNDINNSKIRGKFYHFKFDAGGRLLDFYTGKGSW